jgi:hypothetical protein
MNRLILPASGAWLLFMLIAVVSGALRETLLLPILGEHVAQQVGTLFVCGLIGITIWRFVSHLRPAPGQALGIGLGWVSMTLLFEFGVFHFIVGHPLSELLAEYDLSGGRLWPLVLLTELLSPWLAALKTRAPPTPVAAPQDAPTPSIGLPERYRRNIDKEEIARLPQRQYDGEVSVVNTPAALAEAMLDIRRTQVVGFDTETRPAFKKGESYLPCLVQIATARRVYLLQLEQLDCTREMVELMANPHIIKAGVALAGDVGQLKRLFPFEAAGVVDLGHIAKRHGNAQTGLRNLSALFLGWRMTKGAKTTNWSNPQLTPAQIGYAATDAWASRELYLCFEKLGLIETSHA